MNPVLAALAQLTPYDVDEQKIRIGPNTDGGYIFVDRITTDQTIISYGISTEYRFDTEMSERGHHVYMFDHTIDGIDATNERMHYYREGVAGATNEAALVYSIKDHLDKYGITDNRMILKMDVEGAEWDALGQCDDETLMRFDQIAIEIHGCNHLNDPTFCALFSSTLRKLNRLFTLFHVHANNCDGADGIGITAGFPVSNLLELSYVKTSTIKRMQSKTLYPTTLDYPNMGRKDKMLWFFPFLPTNTSLSEFALCEDRIELEEQLRLKG